MEYRDFTKKTAVAFRGTTGNLIGKIVDSEKNNYLYIFEATEEDLNGFHSGFIGSGTFADLFKECVISGRARYMYIYPEMFSEMELIESTPKNKETGKVFSKGWDQGQEYLLNKAREKKEIWNDTIAARAYWDTVREGIGILLREQE